MKLSDIKAGRVYRLTRWDDQSASSSYATRHHYATTGAELHVETTVKPARTTTT